MEEKTFDMFLISILEVQTPLYYETYSDLVLIFQVSNPKDNQEPYAKSNNLHVSYAEINILLLVHSKVNEARLNLPQKYDNVPERETNDG